MCSFEKRKRSFLPTHEIGRMVTLVPYDATEFPPHHLRIHGLEGMETEYHFHSSYFVRRQPVLVILRKMIFKYLVNPNVVAVNQI